MPFFDFPEELDQKFHEYKVRQKYNPVETEKVEGNLRMTKVRRTVPVTAHYYSNFNRNEQPNR